MSETSKLFFAAWLTCFLKSVILRSFFFKQRLDHDNDVNLSYILFISFILFYFRWIIEVLCGLRTHRHKIRSDDFNALLFCESLRRNRGECLRSQTKLQLSLILGSLEGNVELRGSSFFRGLSAAFECFFHNARGGQRRRQRFWERWKRWQRGIYTELQLMLSLAVIGVLFRWFYDYLLILGIFGLFGGGPHQNRCEETCGWR